MCFLQKILTCQAEYFGIPFPKEMATGLTVRIFLGVVFWGFWVVFFWFFLKLSDK